MTRNDRGAESHPVLVTLCVAVVCALGVSLAAVSLRPYYQANLDSRRIGRLGSILDILATRGVAVDKDALQAVTIDLERGMVDPSINPATYDSREAARDPSTSLALSSSEDHAGIRRRENHAVVYLAVDENELPAALILPIWGIGYQSAIYGYLALASDTREILALKIYEQNETPGLGSRIQNSKWEEQWPGKFAYDEYGQISIHVGGAKSANRVDAISGATRTSLGIDGMLRFWLGDLGFGQFIQNFREQRAGLR